MCREVWEASKKADALSKSQRSCLICYLYFGIISVSNQALSANPSHAHGLLQLLRFKAVLNFLNRIKSDNFGHQVNSDSELVCFIFQY